MTVQNPSIPVYLISMASDEARRRRIAQQFPQHYPLMTRIEAVNGRELSAAQYYGYASRAHRKGDRTLFTPGEIGCALSHLKAYEALLQTDAPYALILEDDVIGTDQNMAQTLALLSELPADALLICGGQDGLDIRKYQFGKVCSHPQLFEVAPFSWEYTSRACAYVLSRDLARAIIAKQESHIALADDWPHLLAGTGAKMYYTAQFQHPLDLSQSHLEQERAGYSDSSMLRKLFSAKGPERVLRKLRQKAMAVWCRLRGWRRLP